MAKTETRPSTFQANIARQLDELKTKAPAAYRDLVQASDNPLHKVAEKSVNWLSQLSFVHVNIERSLSILSYVRELILAHARTQGDRR